MTMDEDQHRVLGGPVEGYEWEEEPDLTAISGEELRALLKKLAEEERLVSYRRRVIQDRIDFVRAELGWRVGVSLCPEERALILTGGEGSSGENF